MGCGYKRMISSQDTIIQEVDTIKKNITVFVDTSGLRKDNDKPKKKIESSIVCYKCISQKKKPSLVWMKKN